MSHPLPPPIALYVQLENAGDTDNAVRMLRAQRHCP